MDVTTPCNPETAEFMSRALLDHAREIRRYALTYKNGIHPDAAKDAARKEKYAATLQRMIAGMYSLMLMARYKGISRYCNREQIEACMVEASAALESVTALPVPDFAGLN